MTPSTPTTAGRGGKLLVSLAVLLTAAVAGPGAAQRVAADDADVGMTSFAFGPPAVTVAAGDTVTWFHTDIPNPSRPHTSTSDPGQAEQWDSGRLTTLGQTFDHSFTVPGTYSYYCAIGTHRAQGMVGSVTVGPATAASVCNLTQRSVANPGLATAMCRLLREAEAAPAARARLLDAYAQLAESAQRIGALPPAAAATLVRLAGTLSTP
jgi:plastocyanin